MQLPRNRNSEAKKGDVASLGKIRLNSSLKKKLEKSNTQVQKDNTIRITRSY